MNRYLKRILTFKLRRRRRYRVKHGAYVMLSNIPGKYQIDDIGFGGLSFHCVDNGLKPYPTHQDMRIIAANQSQTVNIVGKVVAESETGELIFEKKTIKRRCIQFDRLNSQNKKALQNFIKNNMDTSL
ncbi:MAG: hypothetical protein P8X96_11980 [Desulfobacteraceae bacterium]